MTIFKVSLRIIFNNNINGVLKIRSFDGKSVEGIYPQLSKMMKNTFAIPTTDNGVEREFSISGIIVSKGRNRLDPTTISDIMQYKRWLSRTGVVANYLKELRHIKDMTIEMRGPFLCFFRIGE